MPGERKTLSPEELRAVLERLDRVMADAERLRERVTRQLAGARHEQRQALSPETQRPRRRQRPPR